jgi:hypothetical protein
MLGLNSKLLWLLLLAALIPTRTIAQTCPDGSVCFGPGTVDALASVTIPVNLQPSETVTFTITVNADCPYSTSTVFDLVDRVGQVVFEAGYSIGCTPRPITYPDSTSIPGNPYPGTVGASPDNLIIKNTYPYSIGRINYYVVMTKGQRPGYNTGGTGFPNAPLIPIGTAQLGSVDEPEVGQFYKVHLDPLQGLYITGHARASNSPGASFTINLYDANQNFLQKMLYLSVHGDTDFPVTTAYDNSASTGVDVYLTISSHYPDSGVFMVQDFNFVAQPLELTVSPNPVTRGEIATLTILGPSGATVSNWRYTTANNGYVDRTTNTGAQSWSGQLVDSGTGSVTVVINSMSFPLQASVTVVPRSGWAFAARLASKQSWPYTTPQGFLLNPANPPDGTGDVAGQAGLDLAWSSASTTAIQGGPNDGFKYITTILTDVGQVPTGFYWVISPDVENTSSEFYGKQCGDYNPATMTGTYISGAALLTNTTRHESGPSQSHYQEYADAQTDPNNNLGQFAESVVSGQGTSLADFNAAAASGLSARATAILNAFNVQPYAVNYDASGQFMGNINLAPNYTMCP